MSINLYDIYHKVYVRNLRSISKSSDTITWSSIMESAAKDILKDCTLDAARIFENIENKYLSCIDVKDKRKYSSDFNSALNSKDYYVEYPRINSFKTGRVVSDGIVYFAKTSDKPGQIKIGYTSKMTLKTRLNKLKNRYGYSDIGIHFYVLTNKTSELESLLQDNLKHLRVSGRTSGDSNEWYFLNKETLINALHQTSTDCNAAIQIAGASDYYKKSLKTKFGTTSS